MACASSVFQQMSLPGDSGLGPLGRVANLVTWPERMRFQAKKRFSPGKVDIAAKQRV